jgi:hypothetical protein
VPLLIAMLNRPARERSPKMGRVLIFGMFLIAGMANPSPDLSQC